MDIESLIWQAVTQISRAEATATDAIKLLIASLPQSQIEDLRADDFIRTWFRPKYTNSTNNVIDTDPKNTGKVSSDARNEGREESNANDPPKPRNKKPGHSIFSPTTDTNNKPKRRKMTNRPSLLIPASLRHSTFHDEQFLVSADNIFIQMRDSCIFWIRQNAKSSLWAMINHRSNLQARTT